MAEPPVMAASGTEGYLKSRFVRGVVEAQRADGWRIEELRGEDRSGLLTVLAGNPFMPEMVLVVVEEPEKIDLDLLKRHSQEKDPETVLLLHLKGNPDGRTKFGKFIKELGKHHHTFEEPKAYKAPEVALEFLLAEAKGRGLTFDVKLAEAMISRVGCDLGFLHFEMLKIAMLAEAQGTQTVSADIIKGSMAAIAQAGVQPILEALGARDSARLYRKLQHFQRTAPRDSTIRICRFLGSAVQKWVAASHLDPAMPMAQAAAEVGQSPWEYQKLTLPGARTWGREGSVKLLRVLARAERGVLQGAQDPWLMLVSGLLGACPVGSR